jgi:hypothetical protein
MVVVTALVAAAPAVRPGAGSATGEARRPLARALGHYRWYHGEPLNDLRATPGSVFTVGLSTICRTGYAESVRDVPESEKQDVYAEYGIARHRFDQYEVDHLVPLELGGDNVLANLWPEPDDFPPGYLNSKDLLEDRLRDLVCDHRVALSAARHSIATNWVLTYHDVLGGWPHGTIAISRSPNGMPVTGTPTTTMPAAAVPGTNPPSRGPPGGAPAAGGGVRVVSVRSPIAAGSDESLTARSSRGGDSCTLSVVLPSGRTSTADGLGRAVAGAEGEVSWSWHIASDTDPGRARATVVCGAGRATATFVITD